MQHSFFGHWSWFHLGTFITCFFDNLFYLVHFIEFIILATDTCDLKFLNVYSIGQRNLWLFTKIYFSFHPGLYFTVTENLQRIWHGYMLVNNSVGKKKKKHRNQNCERINEKMFTSFMVPSPAHNQRNQYLRKDSEDVLWKTDSCPQREKEKYREKIHRLRSEETRAQT